jgi:glucose-1-phosphate cytidylyltransferase
VKVVVFCGGKGLRLREYGDLLPKPMLPIGSRPILWHIMKYYAHYGHREFILCLGYRADAVKDYFLNYREEVSNDFVFSGGGRVSLLSTDLCDWRITFVDTGMQANIGQRLKAVQRHLAGDEMFLATYGDGLTDAPLDELVADFERRNMVASFLAVRPSYPVEIVAPADDGVVRSLEPMQDSDLWINGGYFVLRQSVFDVMEPGDELVVQPFQRLIARQQLLAYPYLGFWAPMDTLREHQKLHEMYQSGQAPWAVWRRPSHRDDGYLGPGRGGVDAACHSAGGTHAVGAVLA